ncbi:MAG TPA: hypothetical protein VFY84_03170 [Jiangellales bacterium]|nr:hypothetical protein [Jiangellales bacterium]
MTTATSHVVARRWTLAAGLACALAGWAVAGVNGLAGGLVATAIVVAFLTTGLIPIRITQGADVRAGLGLAVLLLTYTLRLALALMALALISQAGFADTRWLGITIIACALSWSAVHVAHSVRTSRREPTVVPGPSALPRNDADN